MGGSSPVILLARFTSIPVIILLHPVNLSVLPPLCPLLALLLMPAVSVSILILVFRVLALGDGVPLVLMPTTIFLVALVLVLIILSRIFSCVDLWPTAWRALTYSQYLG